MSVQTRVVTVRLRTGAQLLIAPATVLPWPRMLDRKMRGWHAEALKLLLNDDHALREVRAEYAHLLGSPLSRSSAPISAHRLVAELTTAARSGRLTVISGHAEMNHFEQRPAEIAAHYATHPVVTQFATRAVAPDGPDPKEPLPPTTTLTPHQAAPRMRWVLERAQTHLPADAAQRLREFFEPLSLPTTAAILTLWNGGQQRGAGFVVDAGLFSMAVAEKGRVALVALEELKRAFDGINKSDGWPALDRASIHLARAMRRLDAPLFRHLMQRVASYVSAGGGESEPRSGLGAPPAPTPEQAAALR